VLKTDQRGREHYGSCVWPPEDEFKRSFFAERVVLPADPLVAADAALERIEPEVGLSFVAVDELAEAARQTSAVRRHVAVVRAVVELDAAATSLTSRH